MNEINVYRVEFAGSEPIYVAIAINDNTTNRLIEIIKCCKECKVVQYPRSEIQNIKEFRQAYDKVLKVNIGDL